MKAEPGEQKIVVIAGPTAGGKTALGVELALALGGEVVSADSMQVYRGMDVGTATPTPEEMRGVPHHLLNVVNPDEDFNAAIYRRMALSRIADIVARGKVCLVVGGTGLYIRGLLGGFFECPPADMELRRTLRKACDTVGPAVLHERLRRLDPDAADRIHPNDRVRITRALEIFHLTRERPSRLAGAHAFGDRNLRALKFSLEPDRGELYDRINRRCVRMVESGLAAECEALLARGYSPDLKPMKAIGYRHMIRHLKGEWTLDEAIRYLQRDTRRYAKRQITWFRGDPGFIRVAPRDAGGMLERIRAFLDGRFPGGPEMPGQA